MPEPSRPTTEHHFTRRTFLGTIGRLSVFASMSGIFVSTVRFLTPNVLYEPPTTFVVGRVDDFPPDSVTFLEDRRLFIFRRSEGMYAVSSICTHLACNVRWNASQREFDCPCHGSTYNQNGRNVSGPAPRPLKWYEIKLTSTQQLQVNTQREVHENYRLKV